MRSTGTEEGWAFYSLEEFSSQLGPHKSVVRRWLKRLVGLGIVERSDWKDPLGRFGYRSLPDRLQALGPRLKLREGRWNETPSPFHSETPIHSTSGRQTRRSTRTRTQDVDVDVDRDNGNYQQVGSRELTEENSRQNGQLQTSETERLCAVCAKMIRPGTVPTRRDVRLSSSPFVPQPGRCIVTPDQLLLAIKAEVEGNPPPAEGSEGEGSAGLVARPRPSRPRPGRAGVCGGVGDRPR